MFILSSATVIRSNVGPQHPGVGGKASLGPRRDPAPKR
jgi:hypothetical protein